MDKVIALNVSHLKLDDLEGIASETITAANSHVSALGAVCAAKLQTLIAKESIFLPLLNKNYASPLTVQIEELDKKRDGLFSEIKRTSKTASQSSIPATAAAGKTIVGFLTPIWDINRESMMSQTQQIILLFSRYDEDPTIDEAAETLGLLPILQSLKATNLQLKGLHDERVYEASITDGQSATSFSHEVVAAYDDFCISVEITLSALPSVPLQEMFNAINDIRRKYISRVPIPLSESQTSVAPIAPQVRTGRHLTPVPRVFFTHNGKLQELVFAQDFSVTYRNNVEVGEAKIMVHGKGKYTGTYSTHFQIVEKQEL